MDNKLSELSKPVAEVVSKFGDPEAFGEREIKLLTGIQQMAYGTKFYSQEYVSALTQRIAELESANTSQDDHINQQQDRIESLEKKNGDLGQGLQAAEKRIAELEQVPTIKHMRSVEESLIHATDMVSELEKRLATPVRLPPVQHREFLGLKIDSMDAEQVRISIRAAGFTVEGDE